MQRDMGGLLMRRIVAGLVLFCGGAFTATIYWGKIFIKVQFSPWSFGDTLVLVSCTVVAWIVAWIVAGKPKSAA